VHDEVADADCDGRYPEVERELVSGLRRVSEDASGGNFPDMDYAAFMDATEGYVRDNWDYIHAFLVRQPNLRFIGMWKGAIKENFARRYPNKLQARGYDAIAEVMASAMLSAYAYWMEHPDTVSTNDIKPLIRTVLDSLTEHM
jgi:hypothetical protein